MNICLTCIVPFFPPFASGNQTYYPGNPCTYITLFYFLVRVSSGWIGIIIAIEPIGGSIFGLIVAKFLKKIGRKKLMFLSCFITIICLLIMGLEYYL